MSITLDNPPDETISDLAFSPSGNYIAASSWDGTARIWELNDTFTNQQYKFKASEKQEAITRIAWDPDGSKLYYGTTEAKIKSLDNVSGKTDEIANLAPCGRISGLKYSEVTGGLIAATARGYIILVFPDKSEPKLIFDPNASKTGASSMADLSIINIAVGQNYLFFIGNHTTPKPDLSPTDQVFYSGNLAPANGIFEVKPVNHQLTSQLMALAVSQDDQEWVIGSITGQVEYKSENDTETKVEKGHRNDTTKDMYAVNCLAFSPERPFIASGGGDSSIIFISPRNKRFKAIKGNGKTPTAIAFSYTNGALAIATGYDYSQGSSAYYKSKEQNAPEIIIKKLTQTDYV